MFFYLHKPIPTSLESIQNASKLIQDDIKKGSGEPLGSSWWLLLRHLGFNTAPEPIFSRILDAAGQYFGGQNLSNFDQKFSLVYDRFWNRYFRHVAAILTVIYEFFCVSYFLDFSEPPYSWKLVFRIHETLIFKVPSLAISIQISPKNNLKCNIEFWSGFWWVDTQNGLPK